MVGNRLKLIRQANALSLQELSDLLVGSELPIKRAALSHYELGITSPSPMALKVLARKLGTTTRFFEQPDWEDVSFQLFAPFEVTSKFETALYSFLQIELEKLLYIDELLGYFRPFAPPPKTVIKKGREADVEQIAEQVREAYGLGKMPVSGVCTMLESNDWHIIELPDSFNVNCISGIERSRQLGYILHTPLYAVDDFRQSLLKAAGYAWLEGEDDAHTDLLTSRFARAMLLPAASLRGEFGESRKDVSIAELTLMKQKYGISKRSIMLRLKEQGIISGEYYDSFEDLMRLHGFPKRKKVMSEIVMFYESSTRPSMRILEAQERGLLSQERADELLLLKHII